MRSSWVLLAGAVVAVAPRPAAADDAVDDLEIPGLDATDLRGDALVWEDAPLYLEPWESGASLRFYPPIGKNRRTEVGRVIPIQIVDATMRSFVEVAVHGRADCTWRRLEPDRRLDGLRLFVHREDLAPVLVKPFGVQYSDGTKIKLAPGVPVMPTPGGDYLVAAKNERFHVPIPHGFVGYTYKAGKTVEPEAPATTKHVRIDRSASARLGDESFQVRSNWIVPAPERTTDVALVQWNMRCLDMTVSLPASSLRPGRPVRNTPPHLPVPSAGTGWRIPTGAPLLTASGREVAVAALPIGVTAPTSKAACFNADFRLFRDDEIYSGQRRTFQLCASAADLEGATRPASAPANKPRPVYDFDGLDLRDSQ